MRHLVSLAALGLAILSLSGCVAAIDNAVATSISAPASEVRARDGAAPMPGDPQVLMTHRAPRQPGDAARADRLLRETRRAIAAYHDVADAEAAGYRMFPPEQPVPVVHFIHRRWSQAEQRAIDPQRPGALLYERTPDGGLRLLGAMFTAPVDAELAELDARVPLSATQWHLHQNVCVPRPLWDEAQWARTLPDGAPAFGPGSPTVTEAACRQLAGRFLPTVFGWMAHINVYADDPADIWNAHYGHGDAHEAMQSGEAHHGGH